MLRKSVALLCVVLSSVLISGCEKNTSSTSDVSSSIVSQATQELVVTGSTYAFTSSSATVSYLFIKGVYSVIDAEVCGPRIYTGSEPFRVYPSPDSPYIYNDFKTDYVQVIQTVQSGETMENRQIWCLVTGTFMGETGLRPQFGIEACR